MKSSLACPSSLLLLCHRKKMQLNFKTLSTCSLSYCRVTILLHNLYSFITATSFAGTGVLMVIIYCSWRKLSSIKSINFWKKENVTHQRVKAFLRNHGPLAIRRYNYSDIKIMTKSFNDKLGQGGYGSVYKGKLQDSSFVAVKVLNNSKR